MLVNHDKLSLSAGKTNTKTTMPVAVSENNKVIVDESADVGLSKRAQNLSYLYQQSLRFVKQNTPPVFIGLENRVKAITTAVHELAKQLGVEYTSEQVTRVIDDVIKETSIKPLPMADVDAGSGSVYSFLNKADNDQLAKAYQHAKDTNSGLDDVRFAAFSLARARYIEAKINAGTRWAVHEQAENTKAQASVDGINGKGDPVNVRSVSESAYVGTLRQQLHNGELFASNPYLKAALIRDVTQALLLNRLPTFFRQHT